jgi:hypothetical protein
MTTTQFDEFINQQVLNTSSAIEINWDQQRLEWLHYLDVLYAALEGFLSSYIADKRIQVTHGTKKIHEEYLGEYEAKTLQLTIGGNRIKLEPVGTLLIGAKGRVDMMGPHGSIKLVLVDELIVASTISVKVSINGERFEPEDVKVQPVSVKWTWRISTPPPKIQYLPLSNESFFDALMEVANG